MFHYDRGNRSGARVYELLGCYRGIIQCDGYAAYEQPERMKEITLIGCWTHVRRENISMKPYPLILEFEKWL